jgi:hypothetical protein
MTVQPVGRQIVARGDHLDRVTQRIVKRTDRVDVPGRVAETVPREQRSADDDDRVLGLIVELGCDLKR